VSVRPARSQVEPRIIAARLGAESDQVIGDVSTMMTGPPESWRNEAEERAEIDGYVIDLDDEGRPAGHTDEGCADCCLS